MKCENCGYENKTGELYCIQCKHKLTGADASLVNKQLGELLPAKEANKRVNLFRVIIVAVMIAIIVFLHLILKNTDLKFFLIVIIGSLIPLFFVPYSVKNDAYAKELLRNYIREMVPTWIRVYCYIGLFVIFIFIVYFWMMGTLSIGS